MHIILGDFMKYNNIRSDLAAESLNQLNQDEHYYRQILHDNEVTSEIIDILKPHPSINQQIGRYIEISFESYHDQETIIYVLNKHLTSLIKGKDKRILVVGLGNQYLTSDAIGPKTLRDIRITHFLESDIRKQEKCYDVLGMVPGVMVQTGMESSDIILSVVKQEQIDLVIVIDALCARDYQKLSHVIQINNVGIYPGAGIGNHRKAITKEILQVPVIAIGVPTVVHVSSIVNWTLNTTLQYFGEQMDHKNRLKIGKRNQYIGELTDKQKEALLGQLGTLENEEMEQLFYEVLGQLDGNFVLSDKQVDEQCEILSKIIAQSINSLRY